MFLKIVLKLEELTVEEHENVIHLFNIFNWLLAGLVTICSKGRGTKANKEAAEQSVLQASDLMRGPCKRS